MRNQNDTGGNDEEASSADTLSNVSDASEESDVFHVEAMPLKGRVHVTEQDGDIRRIEALAKHIRDEPRLPLDPRRPDQVFTDVTSGIALPVAHCAMVCSNGKRCTWAETGMKTLVDAQPISHVAALRCHLLKEHADLFQEALGSEIAKEEYLDYYEEACKVKERQGVPTVGLSVDRRVLSHLQEVLQPDSIQCLMCFICSERHLGIKGIDRHGTQGDVGDIAYHSLGEFESKSERDGRDGVFRENLDFGIYCKRYASADRGGVSAAISEDPDLAPDCWEWRRKIRRKNKTEPVAFCCPEDVQNCGKHDPNTMCSACRAPFCHSCWNVIADPSRIRIPQALANDNYQGYVHEYIARNRVRWIEAVAAAPLFTTLVTYYVEGVPGHLMNEPVGGQSKSFAVRGNVFSYILPWDDIQLDLHDKLKDDDIADLPHPPQKIAEWVRVVFKNGDTEKLHRIPELKVRSRILRGLGKLYLQHHHEDLVDTRSAILL